MLNQMGSKHGDISAIIEIPYIKAFLAKYSAWYSMIKPSQVYTTNGFVTSLNVIMYIFIMSYKLEFWRRSATLGQE